MNHATGNQLISNLQRFRPSIAATATATQPGSRIIGTSPAGWPIPEPMMMWKDENTGIHREVPIREIQEGDTKTKTNTKAASIMGTGTRNEVAALRNFLKNLR